MIAVQAAGCAPVVSRAFEQGAGVSQMWENALLCLRPDSASILKSYGDAIMLKILRDSGGVALVQTDDQILSSILDWARHEGIFLSPEGAAATAAYDRLLEKQALKKQPIALYSSTTGAGS